MTIADAYSRAFEVRLCEPFADLASDYAAQLHDDVDGFRAALSRAWYGDDRATFIGMARVLRQHNGLSRKNARRLATCLLGVDRFRDALELLLQEDYRAPDDPLYWCETARAMAGSGQLLEALDAVSAALSLSPECQPALDLQATIVATRKQQARVAKFSSWPQFELLIENFVRLGLADHALRALQTFLVRLPKVEPFDRKAVIRCASQLAPSLRPEHAYDFVRGLGRLYPKPPQLDQIRLTADDLLESPDPLGVDLRRAPVNRDLDLCLAMANAAAGRPESAVDRLGPHIAGDPDGTRMQVARWIGEDRIKAHRPTIRWRAQARRSILNLVPFNNELTMLHMRMAEMAEWVDRFVIVEARTTFTGEAKPLYYNDCKSEFANYQDKITHVVVEAFPNWINAAWSRDFYQRDSAIAGLSGSIGSEDLVLLTDADEIIDRRAVEAFDGEFASLRTETFRYFFNYRRVVGESGQRRTASLWKAKYLQRLGMSYARFGLPYFAKGYSVFDAGWHFTSVTDAAGIASKMSSYAHQEHAVLELREYDEKLRRIRAGETEVGWEQWDLDDRFPAYLRGRRAELAHLIL